MRAELLAGVVGFALSTATAVAQDGGYGPWMHDRWMGWGHGLFALIWLILLVALVAGAVLLVRRLWHLGGSGEVQRGNALDILDQRYARGEIDRDEYLRRREDLRS